jgi:hypothetical protein
MSPKCTEYLDLEPSLSTAGQQWSKDVRLCLQNKMANDVLIPASGEVYSCDAADDIFFNQHVDCYLHGSSVSYCDLTGGDKTWIFMHAASIYFSSHIWELTKAGKQLLFGNCNADVSELQFATSSGSPLPNDLLTTVNQTLYAEAFKIGWDSTTIPAEITASTAMNGKNNEQTNSRSLFFDSLSDTIDFGVFALNSTSSNVTTDAVKAFIIDTFQTTNIIPLDVVVYFNGERI